MKRTERFILRSKENEKKDVVLRRLLSLTVLFSAVVVPILNEGLLLTFVEAIDGNVAWWIGIPIALRYVSVILTYACTFVSYAAVISGSRSSLTFL